MLQSSKKHTPNKGQDYLSIDQARKLGVGFFKTDDSEDGGNSPYKFSAAEIQGGRNEQEDVVGLAIVNIDNPEEYFRRRIDFMVRNHSKTYVGGSTASMYYFDPHKRTITTANIGDSRVYLLCRKKGADSYTSFLLTQDQDPSLKRIKELVEVKNQTVQRGRVCIDNDNKNSMGVGGAIGDASFTLVTKPDVATFDLNYLVKMDKGEDANINDYEFVIVNACDGLTNHKVDKNSEYYVKFDDKGEYKIAKRNILDESPKYFLSKIAQQKPDNEELAQYLVTNANEEVHGDNISLSVCCFDGSSLVDSSVVKNGVTGIVLDGHGGNEVSDFCSKYMDLHTDVIRYGLKEYEGVLDYALDRSGSEEIYDSMNESAVINFREALKSQHDNFEPTGAYKGIGLRTKIVESYERIDRAGAVSVVHEKGLEVTDIFSPNIFRFTKITHNLNTNEVEYVPDSINEGLVITTIYLEGAEEGVSIQSIFDSNTYDESLKIIARNFHANDKVYFKSSKGEVYSCDNRINENSIFVPTSIREDNKLEFRSLAEVLTTDLSLARQIIDKTIKRDAIAQEFETPSPDNENKKIPGTRVLGGRVIGGGFRQELFESDVPSKKIAGASH